MSDEQHKTEISNPLIWAVGLIAFGGFLGWWFSSMMGSGRLHGLQNPIQAASAPAGPKGPDHMELINALDDAALAKGKGIYEKACASCHGGDGHMGLGGARKFGLEAFQNHEYGDGASPLSMWHTLKNGWNGGAMPPQIMPDADRYAVIHYVRETFIKGSDQYRPLDDAYLAELSANAPAPVVASAALPIPGDDYTIPSGPPSTPVYAVLAETAATHDGGKAVLWRLTELELGPGLRLAQEQVAALDGSTPGQAIMAAVNAGDATAFAQALADQLCQQEAPSVALLSAEQIAQLYQGLRSLVSPVAAPEPAAHAGHGGHAAH